MTPQPQSPPDGIPTWGEHNLHQRIKKHEAALTPQSPPAGDELDEILETLEMKANNYGLATKATPQAVIDEAKAQLNAYILAEVQKFADLLREGARQTGTIKIDEALKIYAQARFGAGEGKQHND